MRRASLPHELSKLDLNQGHITHIFTDIDDTLTSHGKLQAEAYTALWDLNKAGFKIIPVTGRPAGWCEMILRLWPVDAVIGENGGFYFCFDGTKVKRHFFIEEEKRKANRDRLKKIELEVLKKIPGTAVASDQFTRLLDLAIDFCEDVPALSDESIKNIVQIFEQHGAQAKISSIHVNGWFGDYNKTSMILEYVKTELGKDFEAINDSSVFIGDSPNDEPNYKLFNNSIGVANISKYLPDMTHHPRWITKNEGGEGFVEFAAVLLKGD